jgi:hypothetical protein
MPRRGAGREGPPIDRSSAIAQPARRPADTALNRDRRHHVHESIFAEPSGIVVPPPAAESPMTSITRPGGPTGPTGPDASTELTEASSTTSATATAGAADPAAADPMAALAAAVDRGAVAPREALQQLIDASVAGLPADEADELRAEMAELLAEDPYLRGLASELGVPAEPGDGA